MVAPKEETRRENMVREREQELRRRRVRKQKLKKLRAKLAATTDPAERERIIQKIRKISPWAPIELPFCNS